MATSVFVNNEKRIIFLNLYRKIILDVKLFFFHTYIHTYTHIYTHILQLLIQCWPNSDRWFNLLNKPTNVINVNIIHCHRIISCGRGDVFILTCVTRCDCLHIQKHKHISKLTGQETWGAQTAYQCHTNLLKCYCYLHFCLHVCISAFKAWVLVCMCMKKWFRVPEKLKQCDRLQRQYTSFNK